MNSNQVQEPQYSQQQDSSLLTVQMWEQLTAFYRDQAALLGSYYRNLKASGFTTSQAFHLAARAQDILLESTLRKHREGDSDGAG